MVTGDGFCRRLWKNCCFNDSPLVAFALVSTSDEEIDYTDILWMEYSDEDREFRHKKLLPMSLTTISVQHKAGTITLQLENGKSHVFQLCIANQKKGEVLHDWKILSLKYKPKENLTASDVNELFQYAMDFNMPYVNISIDGVRMKGVFDTGSQVSIIKRDVFFQHWMEEDLTPSPIVINMSSIHGQHVPVTTIFIADVEVEGHVYKDKLFFVTDNISMPMIVGMNIIQHCYRDVNMKTMMREGKASTPA